MKFKCILAEERHEGICGWGKMGLWSFFVSAALFNYIQVDSSGARLVVRCPVVCAYVLS